MRYNFNFKMRLRFLSPYAHRIWTWRPYQEFSNDCVEIAHQRKAIRSGKPYPPCLVLIQTVSNFALFGDAYPQSAQQFVQAVCLIICVNHPQNAFLKQQLC